MGKKSAPPAPDYTGAAREQAQGSQQAVTQQTWANRADQTTPWGSSTWNAQAAVDPSTGQQVTRWTQNTTLDPRLQSALDSELSVQQGRADLANQLLPRAQQEFGTPMDWSGVANWASTPQAGQLSAVTGAFGLGPRQQRIDTTRQAVPSLDTSRVNAQALDASRINAPGLDASRVNAPGLDTSRIATPGLDSSRVTGALDTSRMNAPSLNTALGAGAGSVQTGLDFSGAPGVSTAADARARAEQAIYSSAASRLDPQWQQRQQALESDLANRGITMNSDAYSRALGDFDRARNDAYAQAQMNAITAGGTEAQRNFGMDLGLRQQLVGEIGQQGTFANAAQAQDFAQRLGAGQASNAAQLAQFGAGLQGQQAQNQAVQAQFGLDAESQRLQNAILQSQFGMDLQGQQAQNAASQAQFGLNAESQRLQNAALQSQFGLDIASQQQQNAVRQAQFGMDLQGQQQQNAALSQAFGLGNTARQTQLGAQQQAFQQGLQGGTFDLARQQQAFGQQQAAGAQNFNQQLQAAQMQNQLRRDQITEAMQQRGFSLNEINALMSGQQVGMPQFQGYSQAGAAQSPQLLQAMGMGYEADLNAANYRAAQQQQLLQAGAQGLGAFLFSDRRVKRSIRRVGTHARGFGMYTFRYIGERGRRRGVIAQEVRRFAPELVRSVNGVLQVDYAQL